MCWMFQRNMKAWRVSRKWDFPLTLDTRFIYCYLLFLSWLITEGMNFIPHFNTCISVEDFIGWLDRFWTSQRLHRQGCRAANNCKDIGLEELSHLKWLCINTISQAYLWPDAFSLIWCDPNFCPNVTLLSSCHPSSLMGSCVYALNTRNYSLLLRGEKSTTRHKASQKKIPFMSRAGWYSNTLKN